MAYQETVQFIVLLPQFPRACFVHSRVKDMLVIGLKIKEKHVRARNMAIYTGCLKNAMKIQQCIIHLAKQFKFLHRTKELLFSFSMIPCLNRNDEKWPHTLIMQS
jgi:hypothetical protein